MGHRPRVTTSESKVNFEAMWQAWPERGRGKIRRTPSLLGDARERNLFNDRRYLPNVIARIRASRQLRVGRRTAPQSLPLRSTQRRSRRQLIATEVGLIFSTCTLAQARHIMSGCNESEKRVMLTAFFSLRHWHSSRLGRELPPALRKMKR